MLYLELDAIRGAYMFYKHLLLYLDLHTLYVPLGVLGFFSVQNRTSAFLYGMS